jgi:hypothetical protein
LLHLWLRSHQDISQKKLPIYLGFFEFMHNAKKRGKALLGITIGKFVVYFPETRIEL